MDLISYLYSLHKRYSCEIIVLIIIWRYCLSEYLGTLTNTLSLAKNLTLMLGVRKLIGLKKQTFSNLLLKFVKSSGYSKKISRYFWEGKPHPFTSPLRKGCRNRTGFPVKLTSPGRGPGLNYPSRSYPYTIPASLVCCQLKVAI